MSNEYVRFPFREAVPTLRVVERNWDCAIVFDLIGL